MSILKNGPAIQCKDGVEIADKFLAEQAKLYRMGTDEDLSVLMGKFEQFNRFMIKLGQYVEYPFSTGLFKGDDKRSTKFHMGISIVLATIFYYFDIELESDSLLQDVQYIIRKSPLGDETYKASSTNMRNLMVYLYKVNKIFERNYDALMFKNSISELTKKVIEEYVPN